ncbi:hypothetical protein PAESOLCIP111_06118 [Paenibacillus solanacearum]|uniref:Uncharacterized protein n=1 Tax=Paenibacillus solanacearum TaxID=2048548 RepID=A0A916KA79_9BACL|nr:hypothetical protein [Paenibacillus solanacearum]CAG7650605.1 hypothetical protein PAESOLCIP111_06118 [Paenibacillus solanacearum]
MKSKLSPRRLPVWMRLWAALSLIAAVASPAPAFAVAAAAPEQSPAADQADKPMLIYDVKQEKVVGAIPNSEDIRREAEGWLKKAKSITPKVKIGYDNGIIIRIPFEPALPVSQAGLSFQCRDLFVVIPSEKKQNPQLLAFSTEDQTYIYEGNMKAIKPFLEKYDLMHWLLARPKKQPAPAPDTRLGNSVKQ